MTLANKVSGFIKEYAKLPPYILHFDTTYYKGLSSYVKGKNYDAIWLIGKSNWFMKQTADFMNQATCEFFA